MQTAKMFQEQYVRCKNTFVDDFSSESDAEQLETQSCPPAFAALDQFLGSTRPTLHFEIPSWMNVVAVVLSCGPLRLSQSAVWSALQRRQRRASVAEEAKARMFMFDFVLHRIESSHQSPCYSFLAIQSFVKLACSMTRSGVLLFFVDRDCIAHATGTQVVIINAATCNVLLWKRTRPLIIALRSTADGCFTIWDAAAYNARTGCWPRFPCCLCGELLQDRKLVMKHYVKDAGCENDCEQRAIDPLSVADAGIDM